MKQKIKIPTKLSEVTIEKYQAYQRIPDEATGKSRYEAVLKAVADNVPDNLDHVPFRSLKDAAFKCEKVMYQEVSEMQHLIELGSKMYGINPNLSECTAIEYAELMDLSAEGDDQLHNIMQVLYRPALKLGKKGDYEVEPYTYDKKRADLFQAQMTMDIVFPVYIFFSNILLTYNAETAKCSSRKEESSSTR